MLKTEPNRELYIEILRRLTPEQRLAKAFELTRMVRELARVGIERRNPGVDAAEIDRLMSEHIRQWHSQNS